MVCRNLTTYSETSVAFRAFHAQITAASDDLEVEALIVDDCSKDGSLKIAEELAAANPAVKVLKHEVNRGKGAALRTGFLAATGPCLSKGGFFRGKRKARHFRF